MTIRQITRRHALAAVLFLWAAIYLPALGDLEIKGEEGRRILPAITMLETGNWTVPQVGGVDYMSKPPLINWLVAVAFALDPSHSEWAARMPSALCSLALGLTAILALSGWLTPAGALIAAVFALTNIGLMEKGRLAELEALYLSLFGIALMTWLGAWRTGASGWRTWVLPWGFLGLGLLAKGPLHVVFFYGALGAILYSAGRLRELLNWRHALGVALMLGIFALWAVPYLRLTAAERVGQVWRAQFEGRMEVNEGFHFAGWILNIPKGLGNYIPWVFLLPLLWRRGVGDAWPAEDRAILRGGRLSLAVAFALVSLAPGGLPRYTLPLLTLASVLLALTLVRDWQTGALPAWLPRAWARTLLLALAITLGGGLAAMLTAENPWVGGAVAAGVVIGLAANRKRLLSIGGGGAPAGQSLAQMYPPAVLALGSALVMAAITWEYAVALVPRLRKAEDVRPLAAEINRVTAASPEPVCALAPGFLPLLFYLRQSPRYAQTPQEVPAASQYLLLREKDAQSTAETLRHRGRTSQTVLRLRDKNRGNWTLLHLEPAAKPSL